MNLCANNIDSLNSILARVWAGERVEIHSASEDHDGIVSVVGQPRHGTRIKTLDWLNKTKEESAYCIFCIEAVPAMPGAVAFRLEGTTPPNLYLTNVMYGDKPRQDVAAALASVPGILADSIGTIVDYAVARPTQEGNFEGAGFNYSPMTLQRGGPQPNKLQIFFLQEDETSYSDYQGSDDEDEVQADDDGTDVAVGIKSLFGTYWRFQWWDNTVSQSPHLKGDERWRFRLMEE